MNRSDHMRRVATIHGEGRRGSKPGTPEYMSWRSMRLRCLQKTSKSYKRYGGRGITICKRWSVYKNFLADMGRKPTPQHTLERKNTNGPYRPSNCVWATPKQQASNRRNNLRIVFRGRQQNLSAWAEELGIKRQTLESRLRYGYDIDKAFTTPVKHKRK